MGLNKLDLNTDVTVGLDNNLICLRNPSGLSCSGILPFVNVWGGSIIAQVRGQI